MAEIIKHGQTEPERHEELRARGRAITPAVDIFETDENLTLVADLPGVAKDGLDLQFEKGILTLTGTMTPHGKGETVFSEFQPASYYRQFRVSEHLDLERTSADLADGVLTIILPKAEAAKPRRIEIRH